MSDTQGVLQTIAHYVTLAIEAGAIAVVACGAAVAFYRIIIASIHGAPTSVKRLIYFRFGQWLIAALAFQLGADIVGTAVAPTWNQLGHLAAVAVIRTFLTHFLDRDMEHVREMEAEDLKVLEDFKAQKAGRRPVGSHLEAPSDAGERTQS